MMQPATAASPSTRLRYVSCGAWTHIFSEDGREIERTTRWVYDRQETCLLFMDIRRDQKWRYAVHAEIEDVFDSLVNGNPGCLDNPQDWDFDESDAPPNWV